MINISRRPVVMLLFAVNASLWAAAASAFEWKDLWQRKDQQAHALLQSGDAAQAAEQFTDNSWRGISHYRAGNFEQAIDGFTAETDSRSRYNRGVAEVMSGQYDAAIESFESVLSEQPDHQDAAHNLQIARELAKQQADSANSENQQQQNDESSDQNDQQQSSQDQSSNNESAEENAAEQSQQTQSDDGEQQSAQQQGQNDQGELSSEATETESAGESDNDEQAKEDLKGAMAAEEQQDQNEQAEEPGDNAASVPATQSMSEENQATEQWLRRIPDDPSQLLRNKIKLNHLLEHPDVGDTEKPW